MTSIFNPFNQDDLDMFFISLSDFFVDTLKKGLAITNSNNIKFKSKALKNDEILELILLKEILTYIQNGDFDKFLEFQNQLCSINEMKFNMFK